MLQYIQDEIAQSLSDMIREGKDGHMGVLAES